MTLVTVTYMILYFSYVQRLRRELCVWQRLSHKNILVLYGITSNFGHCPGFVCPWLENGSISKYLKKRGVDLLAAHHLQLVRMSFRKLSHCCSFVLKLCEVAAGLSYCESITTLGQTDLMLRSVHTSGVVHGDLTGANILVADDGSACLCDFGLSSIAAEFQGTSYITSTMGGNVRWAAPELILPTEDGTVPMVDTYCDAYSYGSVTLEVRVASSVT